MEERIHRKKRVKTRNGNGTLCVTNYEHQMVEKSSK
jgi:hypothetical protein